MFREEAIKSRLMLAEPDESTRFKYTIWFDYTRQLANKINEGDLLAIPNFASTPDERRWNILEITHVMPVHYAMGTSKSDLRGYPGYLMESAGNLPVDWMEQEDESTEDITKIICEAIPINKEFHDRIGVALQDIPIRPESAIPMVGSEAKLLSSEFTRRIINLGINPETDNIIVTGTLLRDESIDVLAIIDELVQTHVGIFGFTGVGKSNYVSTMISAMLTRSRNNMKVILFDLMGEYIGLLIDRLLSPDLNTTIVCLGEMTLPRAALEYINTENTDILENAVNSMINQLYLPRTLRRRLNDYRRPIERLLRDNKFRIYEEVIEQTVGQFMQQIHNDVFDRSTTDHAHLRIRLEEIIEERITPHEHEQLTVELAQELNNTIQVIIDGKEERDTVNQRLGHIQRGLRRIMESEREDLNPNARISLNDIIHDINNEDTKSLFILISHSPDEMRNFANQLGYWTSEQRRRAGQNTPNALFMFDEADEFIPREASGSYEQSRRIIETLARRGRKFGLGVGIATQRSSYLDTKIMGQLHTYFISKLPRKYDRDVVGEAFAMSEDIFTQTFKFSRGNWLLISHEATGLDAVPIPIKAENAEERIERFLDEFNRE